MTRRLLHKGCRWLPLALALLPSALYAYLGSFSRMLPDDFRHLSLGLAHGPWANMLHWRERWNGAYADYFMHGILAPLGKSAPSVLPSLLIAIWLLGLTWLLAQCLDILQVKAGRWAWALAGASLIVAGCINAQFAPATLFWQAASLRYLFPFALFCLYLALMLTMGRRVRANPGLAAAGLLSGLAAFAIAGFSELHLAFQLGALLLLVAYVISYAPRMLRARAIVIIGGGILGSLASLALQLTAPGLTMRAEAVSGDGIAPSLPNLMGVAGDALGDLYRALMRLSTLESFWLLFAFGLLLWLCSRSLTMPAELSGALRLRLGGRLPYLAVLAAQLALLPGIWAHSSDTAQFFGRFSASFLLVVIMNLGLIGGLLALCLRHSRLQVWLRRAPMRPKAYVMLLTASGMGLLVLPQLRAMDRAAENVLFITALSLLLLAWLEGARLGRDALSRRICLFALAASALALLYLWALMIADQLHISIVIARHLASAACLLTMTGLAWGIAAGHIARQLGRTPRKRAQGLAAGVLTLAWLSLVGGQISSIPDFALYASEWDKRDARLLALRAEGERHARIPPPAFDLDHFIEFGEKRADFPVEDMPALLKYYGFESITLIEEN